MSRMKLLSATAFDVGADLNHEADELVPEKSFCEQCDVTDRTARQWRENGEGPEYTRVGRSIFYRQSRIRAWQEAHTYRHRAEEAAKQRATEEAA